MVLCLVLLYKPLQKEEKEEVPMSDPPFSTKSFSLQCHYTMYMNINRLSELIIPTSSIEKRCIIARTLHVCRSQRRHHISPHALFHGHRKAQSETQRHVGYNILLKVLLCCLKWQHHVFCNSLFQCLISHFRNESMNHHAFLSQVF